MQNFDNILSGLTSISDTQILEEKENIFLSNSSRDLFDVQIAVETLNEKLFPTRWVSVDFLDSIQITRDTFLPLTMCIFYFENIFSLMLPL